MLNSSATDDLRIATKNDIENSDTAIFMKSYNQNISY